MILSKLRDKIWPWKRFKRDDLVWQRLQRTLSANIKIFSSANEKLKEKNRELESRVKVAESQMSEMQMNFSRLIYHNSEEWRHEAVRVLRETDIKHGIAYIGPYKFDLENVSIDNVEMVTFTGRFGISKSMIPELVSVEIGSYVEKAILKHWQSSSILLRK